MAGGSFLHGLEALKLRSERINAEEGEYTEDEPQRRRGAEKSSEMGDEG